MTLFFSICAVVGCTLLFLQTAMQFLGFSFDFFGADAGVGDLHTDVHVDHIDFSHDVPNDVDVGHDIPGDGSADYSDAIQHESMRDVGLHQATPADYDGWNAHHHGDTPRAETNALSRLLAFLSLQTVVAFLAFFGLAGLSGQQAGISLPGSTLIAVLAGLCSMVVLTKIMGLYHQLERNGMVRIQRTVGCAGRVYLRVPGENSGMGKVTVKVQGRTVELKARTRGTMLPTGHPVIVSNILDHQTVEVVSESAVKRTPVAG